MKVQVQVHPNSKKPRVIKTPAGLLHIYVKEPPHEGKANQAVKQALAEHYKVAKSRVSLLRGEKTKEKIFLISN